MTRISLGSEHIDSLDLSPAVSVIETWKSAGILLSQEQQLDFQITYPQEPGDELELSEIPEVRLWFIRLDALYPWMPFLLNWRTGELARYTAMLVPHQFSKKEGIQYNPQALDIFVMHKVFVLRHWLQTQGIAGEAKLKQMAELFGYELDSGLFELLRQYPEPTDQEKTRQ